MTGYNRIVIEQGKKRAFASALDWPGLSRSGKDEQDALVRLNGYLDRYRVIATLANVDGLDSVRDSCKVVERVQGNGATDFGVPDKIATIEYEPMSTTECDRQIALLEACWAYFDATAGRVSAELQKGPRGGGRDRDAIVEHTLEADRGYARRIGVKTAPGFLERAGGVDEHRRDVVDAVRALNTERSETGWPLRYFIRRAAWHLLDHAWEMEDKDLTAKQRNT